MLWTNQRIESELPNTWPCYYSYFAFICSMRNEYEAKIAELEAVLTGLAADKQRNEVAQYQRIAELERMLSDASAVLEDYSGLIDEKGKRVAELFNQTVSQARVIAELEATLRQETAIQETEKDKNIAYLEAMVANYETQARQMFAIIEERDRQLAEAQNALANAEEEISALSTPTQPQRFSQHCFGNR